DDTEEDVAHLPGFADELVESVRLDDLLLVRHIDPAALAPQIARVDDGDVQERGKVLASLEPGLVPLDREHALEAHVPGELPEEALVGLEEQAFGELQHHRFSPSIPSSSCLYRYPSASAWAGSAACRTSHSSMIARADRAFPTASPCRPPAFAGTGRSRGP